MSSIDNPSGTEQLRSGLAILGVQLNEAQLAAFHWLGAEICNWNQRSNLTAIRDPAEILVKHVLDSLTLVPTLDRLANGGRLRVADVGSGAGFPGLAVKVARPTFEVALIEAASKKAAFLTHAIGELGLQGIETIRIRAEDLAREPDRRESFDVALGRAVANVATLAELLLPLVRVGGYAVFMKTRASLAGELVEAEPIWDLLSARLLELVDVSLPGLLDDRVLLLAEKVSPTASRFPRRPGIPQRRSLLRR